MTLEELKYSIENNSFQSQQIVFQLPTKDMIAKDKSAVSNDKSIIPRAKWLCHQYATYISKIVNKPISYIDSLDIFDVSDDIFGNSGVDDSQLYVVTLEEYNKIIDNSNLIIIANNVAIDINYIQVPVIADAYVSDYMLSTCEGIAPKDLINLMNKCKFDIDRISNEVAKYSIFNSNERQYLFRQAVSEGMYSDISDRTIFDFMNALRDRNLKAMIGMYKQKDVCDIDAMGLLYLVCNDLRKAILVKSLNNPTLQNTGCKSTAQIYAIKNSYPTYTLSQLIKIFRSLNEIDFNLKAGKMPSNYILDYIITRILAA